MGLLPHIPMAEIITLEGGDSALEPTSTARCCRMSIFGVSLPPQLIWGTEAPYSRWDNCVCSRGRVEALQHPQDRSDRPLLALAPRPQLMSQTPLPDVTRALPGGLQSLRMGETGTPHLPTPSAQELMASKAGRSWEPAPNCGVTPPLATREAQPRSAAWAPPKTEAPQQLGLAPSCL